MSNKIILMGFMGCGKSTIGRLLAKKLGYEFIDLDDAIQQDSEKTISEIFEKYGESHFRKLESKVLKKVVASNKDIVLALGGGTPCFNNNLKLVNKHPSVYINCGVDVLNARLEKEKKHRPIIANQSSAGLRKFIASKLGERRAYYKQATYTVVGSRKIRDVVNRIASLVQ